KVLEVPFGAVITDKNDVGLALRRAQFAVLNERVDAKAVLGMNAYRLRAGVKGSLALLFSRNVVCVDLEGLDLTELSFINLPGTCIPAHLQGAGLNSSKWRKSRILWSHIKGNSLILATHRADDLENQKAQTLAHQADPKGKRTIGAIVPHIRSQVVRTKPDVIAQGSRSRQLWLEAIEGRRRPLLHGYFCTRQPDDDERDRRITAAEARQAEATYFESTEPWSTLSHQHRFGIKNLSATLSPLLENIIKDSCVSASRHRRVFADPFGQPSSN
ncbi:hypothetical protein BV25DRAFT_1809144, partial [Artomyces pyxidatus]